MEDIYQNTKSNFLWVVGQRGFSTFILFDIVGIFHYKAALL